jgi:hypothetical protein
VTARAIARIPDLCPSLTSLLLSGCLAVNNFALYCLLTTESKTVGTPIFKLFASSTSCVRAYG